MISNEIKSLFHRERADIQVPKELAADYRFLKQYMYFRDLFDIISDIDGTVVECGIGRAVSLRILTSLCRYEGRRRKTWAFDSFAGFPAPSKHDTGRGSAGYYTVARDQVWAALAAFHGDQEYLEANLSIVEGFFDESLGKYNDKEIAFLHIDADLYDSYLSALTQLYPRVAMGGVVAFDEYYCAMSEVKFPGAAKAIDEFFGERRAEIQRHEATGKFYLIK